MRNTLRIHHLIEKSTVNGPGNRFVVWMQGCPLRCEGCFNPETHDILGGYDIEINELATRINGAPNIRGVTFSGGEPLLQAKQLKILLSLIRDDLDILLFSGYTLDEVLQDVNKKIILNEIDAGLFGRYNKKLSHSFFGKKLVLKGCRIQKEELKAWQNTEIIIRNDTVQVTGLYKKSEETR